MAHIAVIAPRRATGELAQAYQELGRVVGRGLAARIVQLFSLRPASMRRMIHTWELVMWGGGEPRATRELVAAMVSRLNECHY
jgi:alkylhydroperoxidase family enzyme